MQPKQIHVNAHLNIKWKTEVPKPVVIENLLDRRWQKVEPGEDDWNFNWLSVRSVKNFFNPRYGKRLTDKQLVNHFPNYFEVTQKDLMAKNIKRYREIVDGKSIVLPNGKQMVLCSDIIPRTFVLPQDYQEFLDVFCKTKSKKWIFKPAGRSRGRGIKLINKIELARGLQAQMAEANQAKAIKQTFVISRYIGRFDQINLRQPFVFGK